MFCPKCGKINPDNSEICSGCNAVLHTEDEKKKFPEKKKWIKTVLVVIAIVVVAAVVIMLLNGCGAATDIPEESMTF